MSQQLDSKSYGCDDIECTLPRIDQECSLESFQNVDEAERITRIKLNEIQKKINIEEMKANPQAFFNFNFTSDDYFLFLMKYSIMKAERQVIEQEYTKFLKKKNINLE